MTSKSNRQVVIVDLFAGGGGASNGAKSAIELRNVVIKQFVAINHWDAAIATHEANHPDATHYHCAVEEVDPRKAIRGKRVDLLIAGPSCTTHSNAKGGQSRDEQSRSSPWSILNWPKDLWVKAIIIENVPEFKKWGPLDTKGHPLKSKEGQTFQAFIAALKSLNYNVEWRILNAADYGDATSRRRLFILARRVGTGPIQWPEPTHIKPFAKTNQITLFDPVKPSWRTAREIIDFSIPMGPETSILNRASFGRPPLSPNTMRRIFFGLFKYGLKDFVMGQQSGAIPRDLDLPVPTIAVAGAISFIKSVPLNDDLFTPYLVKLHGENNANDIDLPVPTLVAGGNHIYLAQPTDPYLVEYHADEKSEPRTRSVDEPLPTQDTSNRFGLVNTKPYIVQFDQASGGVGMSRSIDEPLATIVSKQNLGLALPYPYIVTAAHGSGNGRGNAGRVRSVDSPLPTVDASAGLGFAQPFIVSSAHAGSETRSRSLDITLPTIAGHGELGLARPYIIKYYGSEGNVQGIDMPLGSVTTKERFALCIPLLQGFLLIDILYRMLHWSELAAAMSFSRSYIWLNAKRKPASNKDITKMIGNAWPNKTGGALCFMQLR